MTVATSSKAARSTEGQGTATARKASAPKAPKVTTVAEAVAAYGDILTAVDTLQAVADSFAATSETVTRWAGFALTYTGTARAFSVEVAGDESRKNLLGRLQSIGRLLAASKTGKGTRALSAVEAAKVANVKGVAAVKALCEEMGAGGDPLGTKQHAAVKPSAKGQGGKSRKASATEITPETLVGLLDAAIKVAPHVSKGETAVEAARRATRLAEILTARAATLAMPASKTSKAAKVA